MMNTLTTSTVPVREQFEYWREVICRTFVPLKPVRASRGAFSGEIESCTIGTSLLTRIVADGQRVFRDCAEVDRFGTGVLFVNIQLVGGGRVKQFGREAVLRPGDLVMLDPDHPFEMEFAERFQQLSLKLDRSKAISRIGPISALCARAIRGHQGYGAMATSAVRDTLLYAPDLDHPARNELLSDYLLGLVSLSFAGIEPLPDRRRGLAGLYDAIEFFVDCHLQDPNLTIDLVARHLRVSSRYIQRAMQWAGTSFMQRLQDKRLRQCRRDLAERDCARHSITSIAFRWGFSDSSSFSRAYRRSFGETPRDTRSRSAA